jgi:large subunit ribosomal protein L25
MAKQVKLTAEPRTAMGRSAVRKLKATGAVPAVIYGAKDKPEPLQVSRRDINAILSHASGENILVELEFAGAANRLALMQEVQHAPLGGAVLHVDFHAVSMDEVIEADVPLEPTGTPNGVKNFGGLLEQNLRTLSIECLPRDLPDTISVDVSALNVGDSIHVRDLPLPTGVTTRISPELTAFAVMAPTVAEEPAAGAEPTVAPEVIKEKKEDPAAAAAPGGKDKK